jgi:hypothetical protein
LTVSCFLFPISCFLFHFHHWIEYLSYYYFSSLVEKFVVRFDEFSLKFRPQVVHGSFPTDDLSSSKVVKFCCSNFEWMTIYLVLECNLKHLKFPGALPAFRIHDFSSIHLEHSHIQFIKRFAHWKLKF